jgi:hypothetical protein
VGNAGTASGELAAAIRNGLYRNAYSIAHNLPHLDLKDALCLTLMALRQDPTRYERLARR